MLWDAGTGQILNTIDCHPDIVYSLTFNRDGTRLATTCKDKKIRSIDPRSGLVVSVSKCIIIFLLHNNLYLSIIYKIIISPT